MWRKLKVNSEACVANRIPEQVPPIFKRLNHDWNAEPNAPDPKVEVSGPTVRISFFLNPWLYAADEGEKGGLIFERCSGWRLGPTNDHGWFMGQCRYSKIAPAWGEFYELIGDDKHQLLPTDWHEIGPLWPQGRHFLFYLRDETFECFATEWRFERKAPASLYGASSVSP